MARYQREKRAETQFPHTMHPAFQVSPVILAQKQCYNYVGGRLIWEELKEAFPEILTPFRRTSQGWEYYWISEVDRALKAAQMSGALIYPSRAATSCDEGKSPA